MSTGWLRLVPPTPDQNIKVFPDGPTSSISMSLGTGSLKPLMLTVNLLITPVSPPTEIFEGYGEAVANPSLASPDVLAAENVPPPGAYIPASRVLSVWPMMTVNGAVLPTIGSGTCSGTTRTKPEAAWFPMFKPE